MRSCAIDALLVLHCHMQGLNEVLQRYILKAIKAYTHAQVKKKKTHTHTRAHTHTHTHAHTLSHLVVNDNPLDDRLVEHLLVPVSQSLGLGDLHVGRVAVEDVVVSFARWTGPYVRCGVAVEKRGGWWWW